jgi:tetratricopeptide (TPR) repeat protein
MRSVFISSTSKDLEDYRQAAIDVCIRLKLFPIAMEHFPAMGVGATAGSKRKLDEADLYIGIFAHRYGYIEAGYDKSVTEIEFDYAGERGLDRLCFLVDPKYPWPMDAVDHENYSRLEAFKKRINTLIRAQFTDVNDFRARLMHALTEWLGLNPERPGGQSAVLVQHPDDLTEKPARLFGRDELVREVQTLLDANERVLLQGFGGMGKTALAATIAARVAAGSGPLRAGSADADSLLEALARPFGASREIAAASGDAKLTAARNLLRGCGAKLLVLEDCWNGAALFNVLKAVPTDMPVLVTARQRYGLRKIRDVGQLSPADSLALLAYHADKTFAPTPNGASDAESLCKRLGYHAFALEVAGKNLQAQGWNPTDLLARLGDQPHTLAAPAGFGEAGRSSVADLLDASLNALDDEARRVFLAFGAFFAPAATPELLMLYLSSPDSSGTDITPALDAVRIHGLVEHVAATDEAIEHYRPHDLAYSYARARNNDAAHGQAVDACLAYTARYNSPSLPNFAALRPTLESLLGAAAWAFDAGRYADAEQFAWNLFAGSEILTYRGFYAEAVRLLERASQAAEKRGDRRDQGAHVGNLGLAYYRLGEYQQAIEHYEAALVIARAMGDRSNEGNQLVNLGITYRNLGEYRRAIEYHEAALVIAREIGDRRGEGNRLGNLGIAYRNLGEYRRAIEYYEQALAIRRAIGDRRGEGNDLNNLGAAYEGLGELDRALDYYRQGRAIFAALGLEHMVAHSDGNIARVEAKLRGE